MKGIFPFSPVNSVGLSAANSAILLIFNFSMNLFLLIFLP